MESRLPVVIDDRLKEMGFGIYEGEEEIFGKPECPVRELFFNPAGYVAQDGAESLDELFHVFLLLPVRVLLVLKSG